jgi:cytoskeletal protein CcmA (bactofilin family)
VFKRRKPDELEQTMETSPSSSSGSLADTHLFDTGPKDSAPKDTGVGVPPFRPAPPAPAKDPIMARPPFSNTTSNSPLPPSAPPAPRPPAPPSSRTGFGRDVAPAAERRTLVVGRGISVQGMVQDAERLVVEGTVEATLINAAELSVSPGGIFKGEIEVEEAEIAGTVDGTIVARGALIVRATGVVLGTARCRRLQVEDGGQITGRIEMINESSVRASPSSLVSTPAPSPLQTVHSFES